MENQPSFPIVSRLLHWVMAALILSMLFIGVSMMVSPEQYAQLISLHKPLGIAILVLTVLRIANRWITPPSPLPVAMPGWQKRIAALSHYVLYGLMLTMPLIGWAMLSAGGYPVQITPSFRLPGMLPPDDALYNVLRRLHTVLALALFATIVLHVAAALMHALIFKDGVFRSMTSAKR